MSTSRQLARQILTAGVVATAALTFVGLSPGSAGAATPRMTRAVPSAPGAFVSVGDVSLVDTRDTSPPTSVAPHGTYRLPVAGTHGVPSTAAAVTLEVSVANTASTGYLTVWPEGQPRPTTSNLNHTKEQTVSNLVTVAVGTGGRVDFYNGSTGVTDLLVGLSGYYVAGTPTAPGMFVSMNPKRVLDTRIGTGAARHAVSSAATVNLTVGGAAASGVPSGASAVVLNVTATAPTRTGYLTVFPTGAARPTASTLNYTAGRTVPNWVTVALGTTGRISLYNGSSGTVQLIADVAGYYVGGTATQDGAFVPVIPARILDTRSGLGSPAGPVTRGHQVGLQIVGGGGTPLSGVGPVVMNVTVTQPTRGGTLFVSPTTANAPGFAAVTYAAGLTIANAVIRVPGDCAKVQLGNFSSGNLQLVTDVTGYFIDADAPPLTDPAKPSLLAWGTNLHGDLGDGTTASSATPRTVLGVRDAKIVTGGELAATSDGGVFGWGREDLDFLGIDSSQDQGDVNCSLPTGLADFGNPVTALAGSPASGYGLTDIGDVIAWGVNDEGQLGVDTMGQTVPFPSGVPGMGENDVIAIGVGLAIRDNHTLWSWGPNDHGELGTAESAAYRITPAQVTALGTHVKAVAQYAHTTYALLDDGTVWSWGDNTNGALGNGSSAAATPFSNVPVQVKAVGGAGVLSGVISIGPGAAVLANHTVVTWGTNARGRLGIGTTAGSSAVPVAVHEPVGMPGIVDVASAGSHTLALGSDGSVWAWGSAVTNGRAMDSGTPAKMAGLSGVTVIAAGPETGFAVASPAP